MTTPYQPHVNLAAVEPPAKEKLRLIMLVALAVFGACALVYLYYRFGDNRPGASNEAGVSTSETTAGKPGRLTLAKSRRASSKPLSNSVSQAADPQLTLAPGITQSAIRSPLAVEVVSSDGEHQVIGTRNDSIYVASNNNSLVSTDTGEANPRTRAAAGDPVLAKQQTMEGAVVLLATIDKDGNIQSLRPINGPEVLFAAAREAVKQWHFKPYYASGQPVESETEITVKFAISTH